MTSCDHFWTNFFWAGMKCRITKGWKTKCQSLNVGKQNSELQNVKKLILFPSKKEELRPLKLNLQPESENPTKMNNLIVC